MGAALALGYLTKRQLWDSLSRKTFQGNVYGANFKRGHHLLRKALPLAPKEDARELDVAIIGAGISGLSCAYWLRKHDRENLKVAVFELEDHLGGKSASFKNKAPWGAHYLPLPNKENHDLLAFLKESKILTQNGYDPYMLLNAPKERLYIYGRYQEGLLPRDGLTRQEKLEIERFLKIIESFKHKKGSDGSFAFDIPMEKSSKSEEFLKLDKVSMKDFLKQNDLNSEPLHWYVNYCCRDDYGTEYDKISAWAGLHYFCSRRPFVPDANKKNIEEDTVLTWPQGNDFLVNKLRSFTDYPIHSGHLLHHIEGNHLHFYDFNKQQAQVISAKKIVLALPQFIIGRLLGHKTDFTYSPWMVANINIKWDEDISTKFAWDNVNYKGEGLGFIVSKHQSLETNPHENILTYYRPLTHLSPEKARAWALKRTHNQWCADIMRDLEPMIYDLKERVKSIDIWPWGHAMIRPTVDFLFDQRLNTGKDTEFIYAHSDLSGLSLFEEAFYRGTEAAKKILG